MPELAYTAWEATNLTTRDVITDLGLAPGPPVLGRHMYVPNPTASAKWDFTSSGATASNANAYAIGVKVGDLPSPDPTENINNLMTKSTEGNLASQILRVQTHGGQPPAECNSWGADITVKYPAHYCK